MFDQVRDAAEAALWARRAAELDLIDEADVIVDGLPAEPAPLPSDAEVVVRAGEDRTALTSDLLAELDLVELEFLSGDAAVDATLAYDRVINRATARRLRAVAVAVRRQQARERVDPERAAAAELGAALRSGPRTMSREISLAWNLTSRLTATLAAMETGAVSEGKARVLSEETLDLLDEQAQAVEALVLPAAAGRTYLQHAAAVRRAVLRVDPGAADRRRKNADRASRLIRRYAGDGLADLIVTLPTAAVDAAYTAADGWARARKAAGDDRPLDVLRAVAFERWATSYLTHGDETTCDLICDPVASSPQTDVDPDTGEIHDPPVGEDTDSSDAAAEEAAAAPAPSRRAPTRHGKPLRLGLVWDLASLVGVADNPGELLDSGEVISAADMRALVAGGIGLRRMLIDPDTGELVDLTPDAYLLAPEPGHQQGDSAPAHGRPMWLGVIVDTTTWQAWADRRLHGLLGTAVTLSPPAVRDLMDAPRTDDTLDTDPDAETPSSALAEFVAVRDRHPSCPAAAPTAAGAGDTDHIVPRSRGGVTTRDNLHTPTRRWHLLRTHGGWRLRKHSDGTVEWASPQHRRYRTGPHDYRGP